MHCFESAGEFFVVGSGGWHCRGGSEALRWSGSDGELIMF